MLEILANNLLQKVSKSCPKPNKLPHLVTLVVGRKGPWGIVHKNFLKGRSRLLFLYFRIFYTVRRIQIIYSV